ncbi:MAG TPA: hypothetical protein PK323_09815 [Bacteroidia bacterium]|nr:hypothetical protein [Bacteroidia bacterium]
MKKIIFISLLLASFIANAQEEDYKKKPPVFKRILKNMSFEVMGMRSITLQKEPYPYMKVTPTTGFIRTGYIPRPSYSSQIGVFKCIKLNKSFYLNTGIQFKMLNYKYELVDTPIIVPGINTTRLKIRNYDVLILTTYFIYEHKKDYIGIGIGSLEHLFPNRFSYLNFKYVRVRYALRYERTLFELIKGEVHALVEFEVENKEYFQTKIGFSYKNL